MRRDGLKLACLWSFLLLYASLCPNALAQKPLPANENFHRNERQHHRRLGQEREGDAARGGMDGKDNKHVTSYAQRHQYHYSTSGSKSSSSSSSSATDSLFLSSYYAYDDDTDAKHNTHRRYHHNYNFSTNLSDVWLCLLTALGWTVWMISSFYASQYQRNHERFLSRSPIVIEGPTSTALGTISDEHNADTVARFHDESVLVVRGNVRDVIVTDHGDGGIHIPMYTAVVDYIIEREQTHESIQIRKHFDTSQYLEQGFANVELLVLPEEPTQSILKEDFYQQVQEDRRAEQLKQERRTRRELGMSDDNSRTDGAVDPDNDTLGDILEGYYCKWKRVSTCFASLLVLASLAGTIQVVYLMEPEKQWQGWLSLGVGVTLLLPAAWAIHKLLVACTHWQEQPEKQGFVVQKSYNPGYPHSPDKSHYYSGTSSWRQQACLAPSTYCGAGESGDGGGGGPAFRDNADADSVDTLDNTDARPGASGRNIRAKTKRQASYSEVASYIVPEMSGCYFVHYPTNHHSAKMSNRSNPKYRSHRVPLESTFLGGCAMPEETATAASSSAAAASPAAKDTLDNDVQEGESNDEILSTSSVSSISDQDPTEPGSRQRRR